MSMVTDSGIQGAAQGLGAAITSGYTQISGAISQIGYGVSAIGASISIAANAYAKMVEHQIEMDKLDQARRQRGTATRPNFLPASVKKQEESE
jgi:hypothetical protein